ncbi:MAG: hypothetical protein C5B47_08085 [Verrucomicrobia bacterium]|nr:MAG: hypothetical protein C5B47_08085 [Verrucomicrobiota bacterium]
MSNWTLCGDPHAANDNLEKIGKLFDKFEELGNPVIILGDLFDTKEVISGKTLNFVFDRIKRSLLKFVILTGNHDWFNRDCLDHSLQIFKALPNVTVVDEVTNIGSFAVAAPYFDDVKALKKQLPRAKEAAGKLLFMHQGVAGFDYGNGKIATGKEHGEAAADAFRHFKLVISGHFHKFAKDGKLVFLGTPFSHTFGEADQEKVLGILNDETFELTYVPTNLPQHWDVRWDISNGDRLFELDKIVDEFNHWRVFLSGTEAQIGAFPKERYERAKFIDDPIDVAQIDDSNIRDTDSNEEKFVTWATEIKKLPDSTILEGLEILKSA